jgi:hypothetical protein
MLKFSPFAHSFPVRGRKILNPAPMTRRSLPCSEKGPCDGRPTSWPLPRAGPTETFVAKNRVSRQKVATTKVSWRQRSCQLGRDLPRSAGRSCRPYPRTAPACRTPRARPWSLAPVSRLADRCFRRASAGADNQPAETVTTGPVADKTYPVVDKTPRVLDITIPHRERSTPRFLGVGRESGPRYVRATAPRFKDRSRRRAGCHCWLAQQCEAGTRRPLLDEPAVAPAPGLLAP